MTNGEVPPWTVADRLAKARLRAGLKQEDIAEHLGVSQSSVGKWEIGRPIRIGYLRLWADLCKVPLDWLQYGVGSINEPPVPDEAFSGPTSGCVSALDRREGSDRRNADRGDLDRRAVFLSSAAA